MWRMRIEKFSLHGTWEENCAEELGKEIGATGGNEIPQGGGVGDNHHRYLLKLRCSVREFFKCSRFAIEFARVVIIQSNVPR